MAITQANVAAVTGASGHVGANLVRSLLAAGWHVRALVHQDTRALEGLDVERIVGDLGNAAFLAHAFRGAQVVFHAAARISLLRSDWAALEEVNVQGTRHVVEACLQANVGRLVHFSSIHALVQEPFDTPVDEDRPLVDSRGCPPYDRSKAAGEREVLRGLAQGLDAVILYPTAMVGPHDYKPSHLGEVLLALARRRLPALVGGGFDWVDVRDVAAGALRAAEQAPTGGRYLLSGHWASVRELAALAEGVTGVPAPRLVCPLALARVWAPCATGWAQLRGQRPLYTSVSLEALRSNPRVSRTRATRDLGYAPRPLRETVADTYRWFCEAGMLEGHLVGSAGGNR
jgi:dihydroflavonol-4-reductase